jgi:hypothetical protein
MPPEQWIPTPEDFDQLAAKTAAPLAQAAGGAAFELFQDEHFRSLARFDAISQTEQDRIFNELVVAFLMLIRLVLEAPDLRVPDMLRDHLKNVGSKLPAAHIDVLRSMGVEDTHLRDWETLLAMRYEEYARDRHQARAAAMQLEGQEKQLDIEDLRAIQLMVPVNTVAIGCHIHNCRGQTDGRDELFKETLRALGEFYVEMRLHFEGGKAGPLTRARTKLRQMVRRKRSRKKR